MKNILIVTGNKKDLIDSYVKDFLKSNQDYKLVDFPETYKHPYEHRKIVHDHVSYLKFKNIILTTFSDFIIREINNLIMLGSIRKLGYITNEIMKYQHTNSINTNQVRMVDINFDNIKELKVTDSGFDTDTIDDLIKEENSRQCSFYYMLDGEYFEDYGFGK